MFSVSAPVMAQRKAGRARRTKASLLEVSCRMFWPAMSFSFSLVLHYLLLKQRSVLFNSRLHLRLVLSGQMKLPNQVFD
jgi:hypothetical protein